ncbi:BTAD domain-containing putative transcriptional regulator [Verrucosispora sp. WMMD573]|uniref:BTAD domain-containing putative transcriptional regulator n=1 Tax=Verrucosispora sp. WMMD573 TaxID=3015149 RepID=UPI00248C9F99|nr:BTAD domain-containing putative transcriptional regulator [Verrucosispora sp. WMMD573]WBB52378.1 BTAD domain-containing putative transcriptional regulator [Verrucosispora sp. WMMD573]
MRWPRHVASLLLTAVLLVGPPILLVRMVGWPSVDTPRVALWQWVRDPLTEQNLILLLVVLAWLLWAFVAYLVTAATATRVWAGVRWLRRLPLPTPWQATATGMAGAAALTIANPTTPTPEASHQGTTTTTGTGHDTVEQGDTADGVAVRGGWLPRDVAEQVSAAAGLVWLRRRRAYRPTRPHRHTEDAEDLATLPATVAVIQAATGSRPSSPAPAPAAGLPPIGFFPTEVGLTGPGALDAARGLLITALLAAMRQNTVELVITRRAVDMLLGPAAPHLRPAAGLRIVDTAAHATTLPADVTPALPDGAEGGRRVLILDEPPPSSLTTSGATAVVLAAWPHVTTWHVEAGGHTHASDTTTAGPRVCVLDAVATTDLLTVTGHLHPPTPDTPTQSQPQVRVRVPRPAAPHHDTIHPDKRMLVRVLGEPALLVDGTALTVRRTAARQALVFLAVHPDGVDSHLMAEALWPGLPGQRLTGRLYTTLSELRTAARTTGLPIIDRTGDRYRLHPDHVDVDLWHFHRAVDRAAATLTDPSTAWQAVVDAYTGDLAAGHTWAWLDPHRESTRRHVLDAYAALAAAASHPRQALAYLQDGIRVDPYNADLHQQAARILTDLGEHAAAAELTDRYTRRLATAGLTADGTLIRGGT